MGYWGSLFNDNVVCHKSLDFTEEYLEDLIAYAKTMGIDKSDIDELLKLGYDLWDIEEMLYDPCYYDYCLNEAEYGFEI